MKPIVLVPAALSLLTVSAFGADLGLPLKAAPMPLPFTWTGCYAGGQGGGGWGQKTVTDTTGVVAPLTGFTSANVNISGYMLGGQIGCDLQLASNWVIGIEGSVTGGHISGSTTVVQPLAIPGDGARFKETTDFLSTATARVGYTWDRWLVYAKGGAAWAGDKYSATGTFLSVPFDFEGLETRFGWTAGAGVEWAFSSIWSLKLEYDFYGLGSRNVTFIDTVSGSAGPENIKQNIHVILLGLNFHPYATGGLLRW
jgi:outer membrane immunogenic protein